jgi:murein DD-endopeptidase MepM/ murein hydrolase activator NlpD
MSEQESQTRRQTKKIVGPILFLFLFFLLFVPVLPVSALEIQYPTLPGGISLPAQPQLNQYVRYIYAFSILVAGFIALGTFIFGGLLYFLSQGNIGRMANAREWMGAGLLGAVVLLLSYIFLVTINPQLVGLKEITFEPLSVPEYNFTSRTPIPERTDIAFQIPMGKLIEAAILNGDQKTIFEGKEITDEEFRNEIKKTTQGIVDLTKSLDPTLSALKQLINSCSCGSSVCSSDTCAPQSCNVKCDFNAIYAKADELANSPVLGQLEEKERQLDAIEQEVDKRQVNLSKAIFLTTLFFDEIRDYFSFAIERGAVERVPNRKVEIETLPEWKDIQLTIKTKDGRFIPDPATFYFWKRYQEMEDAINFAEFKLGSLERLSCARTEAFSGTTSTSTSSNEILCTPSQPGTFVWPAKGTITTQFGVISPVTGAVHNGIDIANKIGTPIVAAANGKVLYAKNTCTPGDWSCGGPLRLWLGNAGNYVLIEHKNFDPKIGTIYTLYAHLQRAMVSPGALVQAGQQIGTMDTTGAATGSHLHFEVRKKVGGGDDNWIDPMIYLTGAGKNVCEESNSRIQ